MGDNRHTDRNVLVFRRKINKTGLSDNTENKKNINTTKFATVKVEGAVLGQRVAVKTIVVTNKTTISDLLTRVLNGFSAIYEAKQLFYLTIESLGDKTGEPTSGQKKCVARLQDADTVLKIQSRYPSDQYRFVLKVNPNTGVLTVHDKAIKPQTPTCTVFMKESATCRHLIQLMLDVYKVKAVPEDYVIYEVDLASQVTHQLHLSNRPITIQSQWLDPHQCYFEVRKIDSGVKDTSKIRRSHSLEEIGQGKRLLNIQEIRKTFIQKRPEFPKTSTISTNHVRQQRDVTLTKVREYLLGLRSTKSDQLSTDSGESTPSSKASTGEVTTRRSGQRGRSSEVNNRRTRSLSRDKSDDVNSTKCSVAFGQHTLERARHRQRQRRNSEQGVVCNRDPVGISKPEKPSRSASLDNLSAWERRKLYDSNRKHSETGSDVASEAGRRPDMETKTKPVTGEQRRLATAAKSTCSGIVGKTRSRRTLPNLPNHVTNGKMAEGKRRVSEKVLENVAQLPSGSLPEFGVDGDELNVDRIENSVTWCDSDNSVDNCRQESLGNESVFQPVDPPADVTDSPPRSRNSDKPDRTHVTNTGHVTDKPAGHVNESPRSRTAMNSKTLNGADLPKPVPKLASALTDRIPVTGLPTRDVIESNKPPTLHGLLKSCDLYTVSLRLKCPTRGLTEALELMTSSFQHDVTDKRYWPRGKIPLLGQNGSAFVAVGQTHTSDVSVTSPIINISHVDRSAFLEVEGQLMAGDYLIEFNGKNMLSVTLQQATAIVTACDVTDNIILVVGRPREKHNELQPSCPFDVNDDVENLRSEVDFLRRQLDKSESHVTELTYELQSCYNKIHGLELDVNSYKQQLCDVTDNKHSHTTRSRAQIETETGERKSKLSEIKQFLRQDNDMFSLSTNDKVDYLDYDYEGMHVSAV